MNQLSPEETAARYERIAELTRAGLSAPQIAVQLGVTTRTVSRARVRSGVARPFGGHPLTPEESGRAAELLDDGASYGEVSRTLGRSVVTIRKHFPCRSVWKPGSGMEYRRYLAALDALIPPLPVGVAS